MKTFTTCAEKKAKQILNLLQGYTKGIRITAILILLLMGVANMSAADITSDGTARLYFNKEGESWWDGDNAVMSAYFFKGSTNKFAGKSVLYSGDIHYVIIPNGTWSHVILTRHQNGTNTPSWDNDWNQTGDITLSATSNYISDFTNSNATVTWGDAIKPASTGSLSASSTSVNIGANVTLTPSLTSNQTINDIKSTTYSISPNSGASTSNNTFTATKSGTYTVTATITYNPDGYTSLTSEVSPTVTITVNPWTITWNPNGGSVTPTSSTYDGATTVTLPTPTRTGYNFDGWYTAASGGTKITEVGTTNKPTGNVTYYAHWTPKTYNITLHANDGASNGSATATYNSSSVSIASHPTRTDYRCDGYYTDASCTTLVLNIDGTLKANVSGYTDANGNWTKDGTATLYAKWTYDVTAYTVTFGVGTGSTSYGSLSAYNNSTSATITSPATVRSGQSITFTATPQTGYEVEGWYTNAACTAGKHDAGNTTYTTLITDATNVYVKFVEKTWSVAFAASTGGTVTTPSSTPQTVGQVTGINIVANPSTGYSFANWTSSNAGSFGSTTSASTTFKPTAATTVTANFSEIKHTVQVGVAAGHESWGSVSPNSVSVGQHTASGNITATAQTSVGYVFDHWELSDGITITNGDANSATIQIKATKDGSLTAHFRGENRLQKVYLIGTMNNWEKSDADWQFYKLPGESGNTVTLTKTINKSDYHDAGYEFGINIYHSDWNDQYWKNSSSEDTKMTAHNCTGWKFGTKEGDKKTYIDLSVSGEYTFTLAHSGTYNEQALSITYPDKSFIEGDFATAWNEEAYPLVEDGDIQTVTIPITSKKDVEFRLVSHGKVFGTSTKLLIASNSQTLSKKNMKDDDAVMTIGAYVEGDYTFSYNKSTNILTVTWPVINQLQVYRANPEHTEATKNWNWDTHNGDVYSKTLSLNANTKYEFKAVLNSDFYGKTTTLTRETPSVTLNTSGGDVTLQTDIAGDYTFTFNSSDKKLDITYPTAYKLTYESTYVGGTVSATAQSNTMQLPNTEVTFTAAQNTGYTFTEWQDGSGNQLSTTNPYNHQMTDDITIKAVFVENKASIDIKSSDDNKGTVSPQEASVGVETTVTVTATPADGYYTQSWTATAPAVSSATTGNTTTLSGNGTIGDGLLVATFSERYQLISKHATNTLPGNNPYFTKQGDGSWACIVTLAANTEYSFKVKDYANNSAEYGNSVSALQSCADWVKIWKDANSAIKFKSTQAGSYTIHIRWSGADGISLTAPQVKITYPDLPTTPAVTYTAVRVYKEQTINEWIAAGDGAQATPYKFYNDETVRLTVTPLTEVAGLTAYYKVGETEQTANTFDLTNITTEVTPITITTYYKDSYENNGPKATTTVYFQQVLTPQLLLVTDPVKEISLEKVQAGTKVELTYSATYNGYTGSVTIKENGSILATTSDTKKVIYRTPTDIGILTFTATTEEVAGRVFETSTEVAVYKLVTIKVNDPQGLMNKVYLWRDANDAEDADIKTEWPGESFLQNFGTWHIFTVKYPYYTRFIVNDSKNFVQENGKQTENYDIPDHDACYELSSNTNGNRKYELTAANCPGDLAVGDIANITITQGENKIVAPSVQVSLGNKLSDVTAIVSSANETIATAIMSGTNIIVYGHEVGSTIITVEYTLHGEKVTKTFQVTVEKDTHITIQVKVPNSFGDDAQYQWTNNNEIYIHYWGTGLSDSNIKMSYLSADNTYKYLQAEIPLGTDNKTCFLVYYEYIDSQSARWRQTDDVKEEYAASKDGCYLLHKNGVQYSYNRGIERTGDYCWEAADEYQVKIVMQNGKEYSSNIVTSTSDILSFFAPGKDEVNYRSGVVMLYKNGNLHTTIAPATFSESNVYTAQINDDGTGLTNVAVYTGNYYVRTYGNNDWGQRYYQEWTDDQRSQRKFTYFVPREGEFYNHYWIETLEYYDAGKDVSGWVANRYNNDLAGKLQNDKITDNNGKIRFGSGQTANIRFGYDPRTNYFGRAILKGSGENLDFLNVHCDNAFSDAACQTVLPYGTSVRANKFTDMSNWVYQSEFYVEINGTQPNAKLYIDATAYQVDGKTPKDHLLGYEIDENDGSETDIPKRRTIMGSGTTNGIYHMVVIYDFKTNRLITAWKPEATNDVSTPTTVKSDVIFIRHENDDAPQINLSGQGRINELQTLYFALELERGSANANDRHEEQYWFTLPFDCVVGEISGVPGYMETWGIQRYRGDLRAQKGWFLETPTFWEWLSPTDILKAGEGYLLAFDKKAASWAEYEDLDAGGVIRSILRLYFPSLKDTFNLQQATQEELTVTYPDHTCTITYKDRYKQDSNWKVIGTTSYNNATIQGIVKDTDPDYETWKGNDVPNFRYKYSYTFDNNNNRTSYSYEPEDGQTATYKSFFSYMVQFAGTITWNPINKSVNPEGLAARRYVPEGERTSYTTRLELASANGEKQDQTFVALDEKATTTFDQNLDLNKVMNSYKANIYTLSEGIPFAGNTLPMEKVTVPVGVRTATAGEYTFRMPDGTNGITVTLVDNATGTHTNMLMDEYTVTLDAGTIENRFYLMVDPDRTATSVEDIDEEANGEEAKGQIKKFLIDGKLFIRTADGIFDAKGQRM